MLALFAGLLAGCPASPDDNPHATVPCDEETRDEDFSADMEKTGDSGLAVFTLNSISPDPSDIGDNDWQFTVRDANDGSPLSGCSLDVRPWMPDHEHGSNQPQGAEGDPGVYLVSGVRFIMPGYWENTVTISCSPDDGDEWTDSAVFGFCLEG